MSRRRSPNQRDKWAADRPYITWVWDHVRQHGPISEADIAIAAHQDESWSEMTQGERRKMVGVALKSLRRGGQITESDPEARRGYEPRRWISDAGPKETHPNG